MLRLQRPPFLAQRDPPFGHDLAQAPSRCGTGRARHSPQFPLGVPGLAHGHRQTPGNRRGRLGAHRWRSRRRILPFRPVRAQKGADGGLDTVSWSYRLIACNHCRNRLFRTTSLRWRGRSHSEITRPPGRPLDWDHLRGPVSAGGSELRASGGGMNSAQRLQSSGRAVVFLSDRRGSDLLRWVPVRITGHIIEAHLSMPSQELIILMILRCFQNIGIRACRAISVNGQLELHRDGLSKPARAHNR